MFNMGFTEIIVLASLALIFIGPKQLPEVARVVARLLNELRDASSELAGSFTNVKNEAERTFTELKDSTLDYASKKVGLDEARDGVISVLEEEKSSDDTKS